MKKRELIIILSVIILFFSINALSANCPDGSNGCYEYSHCFSTGERMAITDFANPTTNTCFVSPFFKIDDIPGVWITSSCKYCPGNGLILKNQVSDGGLCKNSYECKSNVCNVPIPSDYILPVSALQGGSTCCLDCLTCTTADYEAIKSQYHLCGTSTTISTPSTGSGSGTTPTTPIISPSPTPSTTTSGGQCYELKSQTQDSYTGTRGDYWWEKNFVGTCNWCDLYNKHIPLLGVWLPGTCGGGTVGLTKTQAEATAAGISDGSIVKYTSVSGCGPWDNNRCSATNDGCAAFNILVWTKVPCAGGTEEIEDGELSYCEKIGGVECPQPCIGIEGSCSTGNINCIDSDPTPGWTNMNCCKTGTCVSGSSSEEDKPSTETLTFEESCSNNLGGVVCSSGQTCVGGSHRTEVGGTKVCCYNGGVCQSTITNQTCSYTSSTCPAWSACSSGSQYCTTTNCNSITRSCSIDCEDYQNINTCVDSTSNCYYISLVQNAQNMGCVDCSSLGVLTSVDCSLFDNEASCEAGCDLNCVWFPDSSSCSAQSNPDEDQDTIPNTLDNCVEISNLDQADCDNDNIGDLCDPSCSGCDCPICSDTDGDGICDIIGGYPDTNYNCNYKGGTICSNNQQCIGGPLIDSSDSSKCCLYGTCGIIQYSLQGNMINLLYGDCMNPNDEGIGKMSVVKVVKDTQVQSWEEECIITQTQLEENVPFYTIFSILTTLGILIGFYVKRN